MLSRRRVVLAAVAVLLVLDGGRSLYARLGYAHPTERWQAASEQYAAIAWPPGSDVPASADPGRRLYARWCAVCHGPDGRGNGPAAPSLIPRPRDFTQGLYKYKSTPADDPPTDDDLIRVVREGLRASAMPYFRDLLSAVEIRQVVARVKAFSSAFSGPAPRPVTVPPHLPATATSVTRGRALYADYGCGDCHGAGGRLRETYVDTRGSPTPTRDLTAPWTFRGGSEPEQLWLRLGTMSSLSPMPSYEDVTSPADRWHVVNYVLSLARVPAWEPGGRLAGPGQAADPRIRGQYLVHAEMCGLCHTQVDRAGIYRVDDAYLAGGMRVGAYPQGVLVSRNITGHLDAGLGRWTEDEIVAAIRDGRGRGRILNFWGMPWMLLHELSDDDARGIAAYLKTLPPVGNVIPAPLHYGTLETVLVKLTRPLPPVPPRVLTYADGNFGGALAPGDLPQRVLVTAQWIVAALGVVLFVAAGPPGRRLPHTARGWAVTVGVVVVVAAAALATGVVERLPALGAIPPERIAAAATADIPRPDPARLGDAGRPALVARGRYLYTVASCVLCHGASGAGGAKLSWRPIGTVWARNLTPDRQTGLGAWSDAEIARAIRSGIARDGRVMHWQAMIWDHASNWSEEDLRAIVAYLRTLAPVPRAVPPPRPPRKDDCEVYTFWIEPSREPGCR